MRSAAQDWPPKGVLSYREIHNRGASSVLRLPSFAHDLAVSAAAQRANSMQEEIKLLRKEIEHARAREAISHHAASQTMSAEKMCSVRSWIASSVRRRRGRRSVQSGGGSASQGGSWISAGSTSSTALRRWKRVVASGVEMQGGVFNHVECAEVDNPFLTGMSARPNFEHSAVSANVNDLWKEVMAGATQVPANDVTRLQYWGELRDADAARQGIEGLEFQV